MSERDRERTWRSLARLERSRALLRTPVGRALTAGVAVVYAAVSMIEGQMLFFGKQALGPQGVQWISGVGEYNWWDFPAVTISQVGWFEVVLPYAPFITTIVVSIGVGIGMSVGVVLAAGLLAPGMRSRFRQEGSPQPPTSPAQKRLGAVGTVAGLTPAMLALVTLGACCSTTAVATAGIGLVAQASGTSSVNLETSTWYLLIFQVVVLYVALIAQEQLLAIYGGVLGYPSSATRSLPAARPVDRRFALSAALRVSLIGAGLLGLLTMLVPLTPANLPGPWPVLVLAALFQHLLPGGAALVAGFLPSGVRGLARRLLGSAGLQRAFRAALAIGGLSLLSWVPAPYAGEGFAGWGNELLGALGAPARWGAVAPPSPLGTVGLVLYWAFLFLLLGAFAVALALAPDRALEPLLWTSSSTFEGPAPSAEESEGVGAPTTSPRAETPVDAPVGVTAVPPESL